MKINKLITEHVTSKVKELKNTLVETTITLLDMAFGDENVDIKLERPITLVTATTDDLGRSTISSHVVDTISFCKPKEGSNGKTYQGYYILTMGERTIESSTFMNISNCMVVYEAVKTLVRHKE
jgi:hypothetical protein